MFLRLVQILLVAAAVLGMQSIGDVEASAITFHNHNANKAAIQSSPLILRVHDASSHSYHHHRPDNCASLCQVQSLNYRNIREKQNEVGLNASFRPLELFSGWNEIARYHEAFSRFRLKLSSAPIMTEGSFQDMFARTGRQQL